MHYYVDILAKMEYLYLKGMHHKMYSLRPKISVVLENFRYITHPKK